MPPDEGVFFATDDALDPYVRKGVAYWRAVCGTRKFPARADLTLRGMAPFVTHSVIIAVLDGGADFEYRFVGDGHVRAFKAPFKGLRLTMIEAGVPEFGARLRAAYEQVRGSGVPFGIRRHMPYGDPPQAHESVFLPLGARDDAVDHVLIIGVLVPGAFWKIPAAKVAALTKTNTVPA